MTLAVKADDAAHCAITVQIPHDALRRLVQRLGQEPHTMRERRRRHLSDKVLPEERT
jgi:hypothetical protein